MIIDSHINAQMGHFRLILR